MGRMTRDAPAGRIGRINFSLTLSFAYQVGHGALALPTVPDAAIAPPALPKQNATTTHSERPTFFHEFLFFVLSCLLVRWFVFFARQLITLRTLR